MADELLQDGVTEKERLYGMSGAITRHGASKYNLNFPKSTRKVQFVGVKVGYIDEYKFQELMLDYEDRGITSYYDLARWDITREFETLQGVVYPRNNADGEDRPVELEERNVETNFIPLERVSGEIYNDGSEDEHTFVTMSTLLSKDSAGMTNHDMFHELGVYCQVCMNNPLEWGFTYTQGTDEIVKYDGGYRRGDIVKTSTGRTLADGRDDYRYWVALKDHVQNTETQPRNPWEDYPNARDWDANDVKFQNYTPPLDPPFIVKHLKDDKGRPRFWKLVKYPDPVIGVTFDPSNVPHWDDLDPVDIVGEGTERTVVYTGAGTSLRYWIARKSYEPSPLPTPDGGQGWPWGKPPQENDTLWEPLDPLMMIWGDHEPGESDVWEEIMLENVYWEEMNYPRDTTTTPPRWVAVPGPEGDPWLMYYIPRYQYPLCLEYGHTLRYAIGIQLQSAWEIENIVIPQEDTVGFPELQMAYLGSMSDALRSVRDVHRENQVLRIVRGPWMPQTDYLVNDNVIYNDTVYRCLVAHKSPATFSQTTGTNNAGTLRWFEVSKDVITLRNNWDSTRAYTINSTVVWNGKNWKASSATTVGQEPGYSTRWVEVM